MSVEARSVGSWEGTPERRHLRVLEALDQAKTQYYHVTAIVIAGMGFFTDAYDLFCVTVVSRLLGRIYYPVEGEVGVLPIGVYAAVVATAIVGTLAGQIFFGWLGDQLGRKRSYGLTLTIMIIFSIASGLSLGRSSSAVMVSLCFFRFWLGFGIGGDYPLSATIMSEYANTRTRGAFIAAVFAMQGFGILTGGIVGVVLAHVFDRRYPSKSIDDGGTTYTSTAPQADYLWRIIFMLGALPAAGTLYYRMRMPETARYTALVAGDPRKAASDMKKVLNVPESTLWGAPSDGRDARSLNMDLDYKLFSREFLRRHGLHFLGTTTTWFFLDVVYYSQNLFQSRIFSEIKWLPRPSQMNGIHEVYMVSRAQCILACCATIPGYWAAVFLVDRIGRFIIQLQGFILMGVFLLAIAGRFRSIDEGAENVVLFLVLYSCVFFFANFGPNTTTFIVSAELFPARLRTTCHGISAGCGKLGAVVGTFGFLYASQPRDKTGAYPYPPGIGLRNTLFVIATATFLGAAFTFLIPETKGKSLEDLSGEADFSESQSAIHPSRVPTVRSTETEYV